MSPTSSRLGYSLRSLVSGLSDYKLFYTDEELSEFTRKKRRSNKRSFALNNGIDVQKVTRYSVKYEAEKRPRRILFIGRFTEKSDILLLLNALSLPQCEGIEADLIGDGDLLVKAHELTKQLGISNRVNFFGKDNNENSISKLANQARIMVYPGGVGLSLIHSMAYGLPSVLHSDRHSHMPEIAAFENGVTGVAFERGSAESLAIEIRNIIDDTSTLNRFSLNSLKTVQKSFNTFDMAERFQAMVAYIMDHADKENS